MDLEALPPARWAQHVAALWCDRLVAQPTLRQCLPTGATPTPVYDEMAGRVAHGAVSFAASEVFLLDEFGGLPPDDPARCETMLRRDLLDHVDLPEDRFHRLDPDVADVDRACRTFEDRVRSGGLDLIILGLGGNGHLGLNEPGSARDAATRRVDLAPQTRERSRSYGAGRAPSWGVTLGLAPILAAREVWLLVTGAHKAEVLQRVLTAPIGPALPGTFLREHPSVRVLADTEALSAQLP